MREAEKLWITSGKTLPVTCGKNGSKKPSRIIRFYPQLFPTFPRVFFTAEKTGCMCFAQTNSALIKTKRKGKLNYLYRSGEST